MRMRIGALLLIFSVLLTATPALADMTESEALAAVYDICDRFYGLLPEDLVLNQMGFSEETAVWTVSLTRTDHADNTSGLYVIQLDAEGRLLQIDGPQSRNLAQQIGHDVQLCVDQPNVEEPEHCYVRVAAFKDKWQPLLSLLEELAAENGWDISQEMAILRLNPSLPDKDALPYDLALEAALNILANQPGFTLESARMFRVTIDGYLQPEGFDRPLWSFSLSPHSYDGVYDNDAVMERYWAALDEAFGGNHPRSITILIDAQTGALAEKPIIVWKSDPFNYLDYFARTPDVLAYYLTKED